MALMKAGRGIVPLLRRAREVGQSACLSCSLNIPCSACSSSRAVKGCAAVPEVLCGELKHSVCQRRRAPAIWRARRESAFYPPEREAFPTGRGVLCLQRRYNSVGGTPLPRAIRHGRAEFRSGACAERHLMPAWATEDVNSANCSLPVS
jgi:hypothetical protein